MAHQPVMLHQVVTSVVTSEEGLYIDATFGRGGHSRQLLQKLGEDARLLVVDRDAEAISEAEILARTDSRVRVVRGNFGVLRVLTEKCFPGSSGSVQGVMMDLGVSSPQLETPHRGFSFQHEGPLDMRMDTRAGLSAENWIRETSVEEMIRVFKDLGEERYARRIAVAIDAVRQQKVIQTTSELARIIVSAQPRPDRNKHGATRVFQAIRMKVNEELEELGDGLQQAFELLAPGGRLAVLSFHSLEDRIVKRTFRDWVQGQALPRRLPVPGSRHGKATNVIKRLRVGGAEIALNPRARSAILRVVERVEDRTR